MINIITKFGNYLLGKNSHAAVVVLLATLLSMFSVPIAWLGTIIIGLITLRKGPKDGLIIIAWALLPTLIMVFQGNWLAPSVVLASNLVVWLLAILLRETKSWSLILQAATLLGIVAVILVHGMVPNLHTWWMQELTHYMQQLLSSARLSINVTQLHSMVAFIARFATGMQAILILATILSYLFISRWWQAKLFNVGGLRTECYQIRMSRLAGIALLICGLGVLLNIDLIWDILPLVMFVFVLAALSLLHAVSSKINNGWLLLISCYVMLMLFSIYILIPLTLLALTDSWYDFRTKYSLLK